MAALIGWQPSTDGDARVNFSTISELRVMRMSANSLQTTDPQAGTEAWAVHAVLPGGNKLIQVQPTRATKAAALTDLATVSGI